jgi:hypothetical protein
MNPPSDLCLLWRTFVDGQDGNIRTNPFIWENTVIEMLKSFPITLSRSSAMGT